MSVSTPLKLLVQFTLTKFLNKSQCHSAVHLANPTLTKSDSPLEQSNAEYQPKDPSLVKGTPMPKISPSWNQVSKNFGNLILSHLFYSVLTQCITLIILKQDNTLAQGNSN